MGMLPWSPLGGGWLSGKYRRDERPTGDTRLGDDPDRGMEAYERRRHRPHLERHRRRPGGGRGPRRLHGRGRPGLGHRPAGGHLDHPGRTDDRAARHQPAGGDLHLTAEETAALDQASDLHATDYPYGEMGVDQRSRNIAGD